MNFGTCFECKVEMDCETKGGKLYLKCPICGREMKADDWYGEYYSLGDDEDDESESYCNVCEHSDEYPDCITRCPYDDD